MNTIYLNGKMISKRNVSLNGFTDYANRSQCSIKGISVMVAADDSAHMFVTFTNGAIGHVHYTDFRVLLKYMFRSRSWKGAKYTISFSNLEAPNIEGTLRVTKNMSKVTKNM